MQRRASSKKSKPQSRSNETWHSPQGQITYHAPRNPSGAPDSYDDLATSPAAHYVPMSHSYGQEYQTLVHARPTSASSKASITTYQPPRPRADYPLPSSSSLGYSGAQAGSQLSMHVTLPEVPATHVDSEKVVAAAQLPASHNLYRYASAPAFDFGSSSDTLQLPSRPSSGHGAERKTSLDDLVLATGLR